MPYLLHIYNDIFLLYFRNKLRENRRAITGSTSFNFALCVIRYDTVTMDLFFSVIIVTNCYMIMLQPTYLCIWRNDI